MIKRENDGRRCGVNIEQNRMAEGVLRAGRGQKRYLHEK
jgi:hypothetical protein